MDYEAKEAKWNRTLAIAKARGAEDGIGAAGWWEQDAIGGRSSGDPRPTALRVLTGMEEGDPEVLDALPALDLSGEWADSLTGPGLVEEIGDEAGLDEQERIDWFSEICDAYETAFCEASADEIQRMCIATLEPGVEEVIDAYVECALWSSTDEDDVPLEEDYGYKDIAPQALASMREDIAAFIASELADLAFLDPAQIGHDFWLTRNGHGAGFWDRGLGDRGKRLTNAAHVYGESDLYVGDDGRVYVV